jgi:hypothetical protein
LVGADLEVGPDMEISLAFDLDDFERRYEELSRRALELRRHL